MKMAVKFRYLVTSLHSGSVEGTNDKAIALECSECEDYWVVDTKEQKWLTMGKLKSPKEIKRDATD